MKAIATASASFVLIASTASAGAQTAAILAPTPKPTPFARTTTDGATAPKPRGVPGFYDPSTRTFTPLARSSNLAPTLWEGFISYNVSAAEDADIEDEKAHDEPDPVKYEADNQVTSEENAPAVAPASTTRVYEGTVRVSGGTTIQSPPTTFSRPFTITTHGANPQIQPTITYDIVTSKNVTHRASILLPAMPLKNGTISWTVHINL